MDFITLILHHGGKLLRNEQRVLEYVGGEVDVWEELECDLLNRFLIIDLCKLHKYHDIQHCYWLYPEIDLDLGLREIRKDHDSDIVDLCLASKHNNGEIEVFFEHPVIPDECVVFSKVVMGENTVQMAEDSSVEVVGEEPGKGDKDTSHVEVIIEEVADMEDVSPVEVVVQEGTEREELSPVEENHDDVVVEEGVEEGTLSDIHSDSYESAEDSLYRPSPIVSEDDEEDSPIVAEIRSKKKNDVASRNTDKGKNVVAESSKKKGKNVVAESSKNKGKNVVAESSGRKGKKKVVDSSKKRRVVTSEESSEDDGEGNPPPSVGVGHRQSYAPNLNVGGFPPTPNQPVVSAEPTQTTRVAPMSQVRPNTPFRQPGLIHTTVARPTYRGSTRRKLPTRGGGLSSPTTAANQTSAAGPFVGGNPSTRPSTISPTSAAGPYLGPSSSSRPTTISPTVVVGPFPGASASSPINLRPRGIAGPSSTAGPFQGASVSTCNRFMRFMPTPGFHPPPPKKP
ncbi:hypothetical protein SESBI_25268 [Sesbania bispinosa]|nr:hypothetical protein SESBI_25268 [Sesbania bispinosa]